MLKILLLPLLLSGCATYSDLTVIRVQMIGLEGTLSRVSLATNKATLDSNTAIASATKAEQSAVETEAILIQLNDRLDQLLVD